MLEDLLEGKEPIEDRYLHNFSEGEKKAFKRCINASIKHMEWYQSKLDSMIIEESPSIFRNNGIDPNGSTELEIRYALNQVAANDPRMQAFELGYEDGISRPDRLALDIAKAFRNNTNCKIVELDEIGLTDNGMLPILSVLKDKELYSLNIRNNKITDASYQVLDDVLSNPETQWGKVYLGVREMSPERAKSLSRHKNLIFETAEPTTNPVSDLLGLILPSKRGPAGR